MKKFAIQYRIVVKDCVDADLFLVKSKQPITNVLINRRETKVKLILSYTMEKVDLKRDEVIAKEAEFHSNTEDNLERMNSNE